MLGMSAAEFFDLSDDKEKTKQLINQALFQELTLLVQAKLDRYKVADSPSKIRFNIAKVLDKDSKAQT